MFPANRSDLRFRIVRQLCLLASGRGFGPTHTDKQDPCQVVLSRESTDTGLVRWSGNDYMSQKVIRCGQFILYCHQIYKCISVLSERICYRFDNQTKHKKQYPIRNKDHLQYNWHQRQCSRCFLKKSREPQNTKNHMKLCCSFYKEPTDTQNSKTVLILDFSNKHNRRESFSPIQAFHRYSC